MNRAGFWFLAVVLLLTTPANAQSNSRAWQVGTLVETEQFKVPSGSTKNTTSNVNQSDSGYSRNTTTTKSDDYDTYQSYTIDAGKLIYIARERLLFPWSKPVSATVGEPVKFAAEKGKLYLKGDDGKEHKATITKTSMKAPPQ